MKRTIFAVIFLAAALMLNGCSAKPAVTAPETQTPVTETTTARTEVSTTAAEMQELPKGYFTWYPKDVQDNQTQLVAQLDQLYAYMLMLTPCLMLLATQNAKI